MTHGKLWFCPGARHSPAVQTAAQQHSGSAEATAAHHRFPALNPANPSWQSWQRESDGSCDGSGRARWHGGCDGRSLGSGLGSCRFALSFPLLNIPAQQISCIYRPYPGRCRALLVSRGRVGIAHTSPVWGLARVTSSQANVHLPVTLVRKMKSLGRDPAMQMFRAGRWGQDSAWEQCQRGRENSKKAKKKKGK